MGDGDGDDPDDPEDPEEDPCKDFEPAGKCCECGACCMCRCTCGKWGSNDCCGQSGCNVTCPENCFGPHPHVGTSSCCACHCVPEEPEEPEEGDYPALVPGQFSGSVTPGYFGTLTLPPPEGEIPPVTVPTRITSRFESLMDSFTSKLGGEELMKKLKVTSGSFGEFCIENPFKEFGGMKMPEFKSCIDFDKLANESYMKLIRQVLLFMVVLMFFSSVIVVLRQY
jgi:hypothetical protein